MTCFNQNTTIEPKEGDVEPILALIRHLVSGVSSIESERQEAMHWLLCWMAYPLQNGGAKIPTAVVLQGEQGAGKSLLIEPLLEIYGLQAAQVCTDALEYEFNSWITRKQFIVVDELPSVNALQPVKELVTEPMVRVNDKHRPYYATNLTNFIFLSNDPQPIVLTDEDRRFFIIPVPSGHTLLHHRVHMWLHNGGAAAFLHYLLHYPLDGFNPFAPPPSLKTSQQSYPGWLRDIEWASVTADEHGHAHSCCPRCGGAKPEHLHGCELAALLAGVT